MHIKNPWPVVCLHHGKAIFAYIDKELYYVVIAEQTKGAAAAIGVTAKPASRLPGDGGRHFRRTTFLMPTNTQKVVTAQLLIYFSLYSQIPPGERHRTICKPAQRTLGARLPGSLRSKSHDKAPQIANSKSQKKPKKECLAREKFEVCAV